jgi:hypothetical protein
VGRGAQLVNNRIEQPRAVFGGSCRRRRGHVGKCAKSFEPWPK